MTPGLNEIITALVVFIAVFVIAGAVDSGINMGRAQVCRELLHNTTAVYKKGATPCVVPGATNQEGE